MTIKIETPNPPANIAAGHDSQRSRLSPSSARPKSNAAPTNGSQQQQLANLTVPSISQINPPESTPGTRPDRGKPGVPWPRLAVDEHVRYCRELARYCKVEYGKLAPKHFLEVVPHLGHSLLMLLRFYGTEAADILRNSPLLPPVLARPRASEPLDNFDKAKKAVRGSSGSFNWARMSPAMHIRFCKMAAEVLGKDYRTLKARDLTLTRIPKLGGRTLERLYVFYKTGAAASLKDFPGLPPVLSGKSEPFSTFKEVWAELHSKAGRIDPETWGRMSADNHVRLLKILARTCGVEDYRWLKSEHFFVTIPTLGTSLSGLNDFYHSAEGQLRLNEAELPRVLSGRFPFHSTDEALAQFLNGAISWSDYDVKWQVELLKIVAKERELKSYRDLRVIDFNVPIAAFNGQELRSLLEYYRSSASEADRNDPRLPTVLRVANPADLNQVIEHLSANIRIKWECMTPERQVELFVDLSRSLAASLKKPFEGLCVADYQTGIPLFNKRNLGSTYQYFQRAIASKLIAEALLVDIPPAILPQTHTLRQKTAPRDIPEREFAQARSQEITCILSYSVDPKRDIAILQADNAQAKLITLDRLSEMYLASYHSIPHLQYFERGNSTVNENSTLAYNTFDFQELLARSVPAYRGTERARLEGLFEQTDPALRPYLVQTARELVRHTGSITGFVQMLSVLHNACNFDQQTTLDIVSRLPHFGELISEALVRFCQLAELPPQKSAQFIPGFQRFSIEAIYPGGNSGSLEAAQHSLTKLRRAFLIKPGPNGQSIPKDELDRALKLLPLVKARQSELQSMQPFEISRLAGALWKEGGAPVTDELQVEFLAIAQAVHKICRDKGDSTDSEPNSKKPLFGYAANDTQLVTLMLLMGNSDQSIAAGRCAQVKTGEGKTLELAYLAAYRSIVGQKVHIESSTDLLAQAHINQYRGFYKVFRFDCEHFQCARKLQEGRSGKYSLLPRPRERASQRIDGEGRRPMITAATQESYVFAGAMARHYGQDHIRQDHALLDEADTLNDNTSVIHQLSGTSKSGISPDTLTSLRQFVADHGVDWVISHMKTSTNQLRQAIPELGSLPPQIAALYLQSEIVSHTLRRDRDYVTENGRVIIVDYQNTGRLLDTRWMFGLEAIIAMRENLKIPAESRSLTEISGVNHWRKYGRVDGLTGTLGPGTERRWFENVLELQSSFDAPPHLPSRAAHSKPIVVASQDQQISAAVDCARNVLTGQGRAMIITVNSIEEATTWHNTLRTRGFTAQLITGKNDLNLDQEGLVVTPEKIVQQAGQSHMLTIVTTFGSRGIDFRPSAEVHDNGGLHNFITFIPTNARLLEQIQGRVARQGEMGSSDIIASWSSDRFIAELPAQARTFLEQTLVEYGSRAFEFQRALDLVQRATYVEQGIVRRAAVAKDVQMQHALNHFYQIIHRTVSDAYIVDSNLAHLNLFAKVMGGTNGSPGIEQPWSDAVERVKALVHYHRIYRDSANIPRPDMPLSKETAVDLQDAFQDALAGPIQKTSQTTRFEASTVDLLDFYRKHLSAVEFQNSTCSPDAYDMAMQSSADLIASAADERVKHLVHEYTNGGTARITHYARSRDPVVSS